MPDSVALLTPHASFTFAELRTSTRTGLLRATLEPSTIAAIYGTTVRGTLALLHPQASDADEASLRAWLEATTLDADTLSVLSTSGSTGTPKRVELSRQAWRAHVEASNAHLMVRSDDRWLVTLPLAHTGGLAVVLRCLAARAMVVLGEVPKLGPAFARWVQERIEDGVTRLSLVPAQLAWLLDEGVHPDGLRSVLLGGQASPPALVQRALDRGWPTVTSYGMTETCGMCVASKIGEAPSDIVGRPLRGVSLRIVDEQLELDSPARATGVHGADAFTSDGWLRTEDRALVTDAGLVLLGRADDVIIASGHKVSPLEVEAQLATLDGVAAAAVTGIPHEVHGQTVAALIVPRVGADRDALLHPAPPALAPYKRPRKVVLVEALPLLATGKLDRAAVRALLLQ